MTPLITESLVRFYRRMARAWRSPAPPDAVAVAALSRVVELHHHAATAIQAELMSYVREDLDHVAAAHLELASCSDIPALIRQRLELLSRSAENLAGASQPGPP